MSICQAQARPGPAGGLKTQAQARPMGKPIGPRPWILGPGLDGPTGPGLRWRGLCQRERDGVRGGEWHAFFGCTPGRPGHYPWRLPGPRQAGKLCHFQIMTFHNLENPTIYVLYNQTNPALWSVQIRRFLFKKKRKMTYMGGTERMQGNLLGKK